MVLVELLNEDVARDFYLNFNGKRFNSMEKKKCQIVFVSNVVMDEEEDEGLASPRARARPVHTETEEHSSDEHSHETGAAAHEVTDKDTPGTT